MWGIRVNGLSGFIITVVVSSEIVLILFVSGIKSRICSIFIRVNFASKISSTGT